MTGIEYSLQRSLDADPTETTTRRVLADHLLETGDPRGEGYLALAHLGLYACTRGGMPGFARRDATQRYSGKEVDAEPEKFERRLKGCHPFTDHGRIFWELPALACHVLPLRWYNRCWGNDDHRSRDELPWLISSLKLAGREDLDNAVAREFLKLPEAYRLHLTTCAVPFDPQFTWPCPVDGLVREVA